MAIALEFIIVVIPIETICRKYPGGGELYVVADMMGGSTFPCDWISVDAIEQYIWLTGTEPGEVVSR